MVMVEVQKESLNGEASLAVDDCGFDMESRMNTWCKTAAKLIVLDTGKGFTNQCSSLQDSSSMDR